MPGKNTPMILLVGLSIAGRFAESTDGTDPVL
jgi:hypothetical protein